jgi:ligand-binding sensor domain-containing protein/DNA-binding CsgD family transcriptional regulator
MKYTTGSSVCLAILLLACTFFPLSAAGVAGLRFERMDRYQGFPADSVNTVFQDRFGFMWVGCDEGLLRYDGIAFRLFRPESDSTRTPGTSFSVSAITQDNQGTFWIGTYGAGLFTLNPNSEEIRLEPYLPPEHASRRFFIYKLMPDTSGSIWIATWGFGLSRLDPVTRKTVHYPAVPGGKGPISSAFVRPITERNDGSIWMGAGDGLVYRFDPVTQSFSQHALYLDDARKEPLNDVVFSLLFDSDDELWVGTLNSGLWLCRFHNNQLDVIQRFRAENRSDRLGDNHIRDLLETYQSPGQIWICTDYGLYLLNKKSEEVTRYLASPNDSFSLSRNYLSCIFQDRTGLLWLGTINGGLMKFSPTPNPFVTQVPQIEGEKRNHSEVTALLKLDGSRILLGGLAGNLTLAAFRGGLLTGEQIALSENDLNSNRIQAIAPDPEKPLTFLVGTTWSGLKRVTLSESGPIISSAPLTHTGYHNNSFNTINAILPIARREIWIATNAGLYQTKGEQTRLWTMESSAGLLPDNRVNALFHDGDGHIWIGTQRGIALFSTRNETFVKLQGLLEPLSQNTHPIRCIHKSPLGDVWIGTANGIIKIPRSPDSAMLHLSHADGLAHNNIQTIQSDKLGHLWLGTPAGISRYDPISKRFFNYDHHNGLFNHRLVSSHYQADTDLMVFGGINGLTTFHPSQIRPAPNAPTILFTGFETVNPRDGTTVPLILDKPAHLNEKISLKQGASIIIHFSAMDFTAPGKNQYQYRLMGYDEAWSFSTFPRQMAHFHSLKPGRYQFQVKGSNSDGVWNAIGATLTIEVKAAWWNSRIVMIIGALGLCIGLILLYRNRLHIASFRKTEREKLKIFFDAHAISHREMEIIELIIAGHSNKEIEDILFISLPTVKSHIYHIFKKLGVGSRPQLLALINRYKGISDTPT